MSKSKTTELQQAIDEINHGDPGLDTRPYISFYEEANQGRREQNIRASEVLVQVSASLLALCIMGCVYAFGRMVL